MQSVARTPAALAQYRLKTEVVTATLVRMTIDSTSSDEELGSAVLLFSDSVRGRLAASPDLVDARPLTGPYSTPWYIRQREVQNLLAE